MHRQPKILILYAHIQPFLLAGINKLIENYNASVLVVSWEQTSDAPTACEDTSNLAFVVKTGTGSDIKKKVLDFDADIVFCSGWMDKDYLSWASAYKKRGKITMMASDAQWTGTLKQRLNCLFSPFFLKAIYTHAWIPGYFQYEYARRLGFKKENILINLLTPDVGIFDKSFSDSLPVKEKQYPKSLLYIGRLEPGKFKNLLLAFSSLSEQDTKGWNMIVAGKGSLEEHPAMKDPRIVYKGFLPQKHLAGLFHYAGVFCLTSSGEAWGTVIQEAGAAGMPLLISRQCGAHYSMLIDNYNGLLCDGDSVEDIKRAIKQMTDLPAGQLLEMGKRSHKVATAIDSNTWAATLMSVYK